jgi:hypothetical protein
MANAIAQILVTSSVSYTSHLNMLSTSMLSISIYTTYQIYTTNPSSDVNPFS